MNQNDIAIMSAAQVKASIDDSDKDMITLRMIKQIINKELKMRFLKIKKIQKHDNSERSLVLR